MDAEVLAPAVRASATLAEYGVAQGVDTCRPSVGMDHD